MDAGLLQATIDVVFKGNLLYLSPILILFMGTMFADRLIDLLFNSIDRRKGY